MSIVLWCNKLKYPCMEHDIIIKGCPDLFKKNYFLSFYSCVPRATVRRPIVKPKTLETLKT